MELLNAVVDLSHHNTFTSLQPAKDAGILGVVHKATQGTGYADPKYAAHRALAKEAGMMWGAYHFGVAGNVDQQAAFFLKTAAAEADELLVLDFENNSTGATMTLAEAETFVETIYIQRGRYPGLYSGQAFITAQLASRTDSILGNCFLWVARYSDTLPNVPPTWPMFTLWQYTDGKLGPEPHAIPGIGNCDRDKFNGDEAALRKLWGVV